MNQMSTTLNDEHWLNLITQCGSSGLTDCQWCIENGIPVSIFYYYVQALRKKACKVPEAVYAAAQKQEVVQIPLWERKQHSDTIALHTPSICLEMQGIRIEIYEQAWADVIRNTLLAPAVALLAELSGVAKFFLVTGYADYPRRIIIQEEFGYHSGILNSFRIIFYFLFRNPGILFLTSFTSTLLEIQGSFHSLSFLSTEFCDIFA